MTRARQRFERRCNHQLEIPFRKYPIRVLPIHHFALFGNLYMTREGIARLRNYRVMGWSPTAPNGSTSTMKQCELYVAFGSDSMQRAMGLEYLPGAGEHPAILVGIRVPKHHLLPSFPRIEQTSIVGAGP